MKKCTYKFVFFTFLLFSISCKAQQKSQNELSEKITALLSKQFKSNEPGGVVLVAKKGHVIYSKAFGIASLELNVPMQPEMVFNLGSITKQFTAVAILQLADQGKLSLQDSIQQYINNFPSKGYTITIENLLTHTSGIKDYMQIDYQTPFMERRDFMPAALIDSFKNFPLDFEPGTKFQYSNSGYFLLGYIIEKITGKTYQAYLKENIFVPLGLLNTYTDDAESIFLNRVNGYKKNGDHIEKAAYWSSTIAYAAGGLISNVNDLFKWHQGLYSYKILKKETLEKAFKPYTLKDGRQTEYGYGWFIKKINGIRSIEHGGAITGFLTNEMYYPDENIFVATLFNCDCAPKDLLTANIAELALGKTFQADVKMEPALLDEYAGTYALTIDTSRTVKILKENNQLQAAFSGQGTYKLVFKSDTEFEFKTVLGAYCKFIRKNGKISKFTVSQDGLYEWIKIE